MIFCLGRSQFYTATEKNTQATTINNKKTTTQIIPRKMQLYLLGSVAYLTRSVATVTQDVESLQLTWS